LGGSERKNKKMENVIWYSDWLFGIGKKDCGMRNTKSHRLLVES
jgi:hypothetical protein